MPALPQIFIDGQEGTTGLRIREMLAGRRDLELLLIPRDQRRDPAARREFLNRADLAILCLPDEAAAAALELIDNAQVRLIDTSTPRRVAEDWVYGLPEISPAQRRAIRGAARVANCGCYPVGFILAVRPLVEAGLLDAAAPFVIHAVSGYSGGGRKMIAAYQGAPPPAHPRDAAIPLCLYALDLGHKHLAEIQHFGLVEQPPIFVPSVAHAYCGMLVSTPVPRSYFKVSATPQQVWEVWQQRYAGEPFVHPVPPEQAGAALRQGRFLDLGGCNLTNRLDLFVFGDPGKGLVLIGRLDNLGKGASGNAVQCMNLMLGLGESTGLQA